MKSSASRSQHITNPAPYGPTDAFNEEQLAKALKIYFGFDQFRPLQKEIIQATLGGKDVMAILPTGAGKSLCFQLPAILSKGVTVVVSPLIALMKDQVDQLDTAGIPGTFLNSSLSSQEAGERMRGLLRGKYKLLYIAPERMMMESCLSFLRDINVSRIAVDEAHCISEWGHDFRPDYRKLALLREELPGVPVIAVTATATSSVREDIVRGLQLKEPASFIASFNRPNLAYRVIPKEPKSTFKQLVDFLEDYEGESGIIYCYSRDATERLAEQLSEDGIPAVAYHAGLSAEERNARQEKFIRDDIEIICATVAFGMGINKPNVRFVVHYDLPKSIEGYYQETGRAGRDGLPAECALFFSAGDAAKQRYFINQKNDELDKRVASQQLEEMVRYGESFECRRALLLRYFGEQPNTSAVPCGGCDNCNQERKLVDRTELAQKLLSCVYRVEQASGLSFGLSHISSILKGTQGEVIERWRHDKLSTFGIGTELSLKSWVALGRQLVAQGYLESASEEYSTYKLSEEGRAVLKNRKQILLPEMKLSKQDPSKKKSAGRQDSKPNQPQGSKRAGKAGGATKSDFNTELFERLRALRRRLADERNVPSYVIFGDASLQDMARKMPKTEKDFLEVFGVGETKLQQFGAVFLEEIMDFS